MTQEKHLLNMPSPLHYPASQQGLRAAVKHRDQRGQSARTSFFSRAVFHDINALTARDIKWDGPAFAAGELIIGSADSESVRCQLRKSELLTAVDKAVGI
jgi:hypothetical protein